MHVIQVGEKYDINRPNVVLVTSKVHDSRLLAPLLTFLSSILAIVDGRMLYFHSLKAVLG